MQIERRFGTSPAQRGCNEPTACPDVLRMKTGDYLVIGKIADLEALRDEMADMGAGVGEDEAAVIVPAQVVEHAAQHIAEEAAPARVA